MSFTGINLRNQENIKNQHKNDIYGGFDDVSPEYNLSNLTEDEEYQEALRNVTWGKRSVTPKTPGTALNIGQGYSRQNTAGIPRTGGPNAATPLRPPTAIRGAGYASGVKSFDTFNKNRKVLGAVAEAKREETTTMRFKNMERKITNLLDECYLKCASFTMDSSSKSLKSSRNKPDYSATLAKAREASTLERALIRMQEEAGHKDHNFDLTYAVLYNMAVQYTFNEMYEEALNAYTLMTKNKLFSNANRLKINMGNIYFKMGQYKNAIKMYHMALDQVPSTQTELRLKIMHNLAAAFIKTKQYQEASTNLEYIMSEKSDTKSGLRLILCYYALEDIDNMKLAFKKLLNVDLDILDTDSYIDPIVDPDLTILKDVIMSDDMSQIEQKLKLDAERCILLAAKVISPAIEDSYVAGYNWCVDCLKDSVFSVLANQLEMHNAISYLKRKQIMQAIDTLKVFEKKEDKIAHMASVNLSFIYHLQGHYTDALKYTTQAKRLDIYSAPACVNHGACQLSLGNIEKAKEDFMGALVNDSSCIEAIYNLGLVHKMQGQYDQALECFRKLEMIYANAIKPPMLYQLAHLYELKGDVDAATEFYQQIIALDSVDPGVLQKMGGMYDRDNSKEQAFIYLSDAHRFYPMNFDVINWLGSFYVEKLQAEAAHSFFEKAVLASPNTIKWRLLSASCYRKTGNYQKALAMYKDVHHRFPENVECLRILVEMCNNQGLKDAEEYAGILKTVERIRAARERIGSTRPGSRRTNSGLSSQSFSPTMDHSRINQEGSMPGSPMSIRSTKTSRLNLDSGISSRSGNKSGSSDGKQYGSNNSKPIMLGNLEYEDPLGPLPERPRTVMQTESVDEFSNHSIDEDLLPF